MEQEIKHSSLGASTCHRWWECPGSVKLIATLPEQEQSFDAAKGTAAHIMAEKLLKRFKEGKKFDIESWIGHTEMIGDYEIEYTEDMVEAVTVYIDAIQYETKRLGTGVQFLSIEEPFNLDVDKEAWGINDCSLYIPFDRLLVWDYKNGVGVVEVYNNKQLMYYALGALKGKDVDRVDTYIIQPNAYHPEGVVRRCSYTIDQLKDFEKQLKIHIGHTRRTNAPLRAGDHCKWCPAIGDCPEVRAETEIIAKQDFATVKDFPTEHLIKLVSMSPRILDFLKEAQLTLKAKAERGETVEGFKLVKAKSNRIWSDPKAVVNSFSNIFGDEMYGERKLKTPAQMEKMAKGILQNDELLPYIEKPNNGLQLVLNSDPRKAVKESAGEDFKDV